MKPLKSPQDHLGYPLYLALIFAVVALNSAFASTLSDNEPEIASMSVDSLSVAKARLDYAVPDAPAFKMIDIDPSGIMRPTSARDLAGILSTIGSNGGGIELAPGLLFGDPNLSQYKDDPFWYRVRLSASMKLVENGGKDIAFGVRTTILDKSDLRSDDLLTQKLVEIGHMSESIRNECKDYIVDTLRVDPIDNTSEFNRIFDSCYTARLETYLETNFDALIEHLRKQAKERNWNRAIMELGSAYLLSGSDSTLRSLTSSKYALWFSYGFPLGPSGQCFIGINGQRMIGKTGKLDASMAAAAVRFYFGNNERKVYGQMDWKGSDGKLPEVYFSLGGELMVSNGIWIDASLGLLDSKERSSAQLVTTLNLRLATPEL